MNRLGTLGATALVVVFVAVVLFAIDALPAQASHLGGNTGSPKGPSILRRTRPRIGRGPTAGRCRWRGLSALPRRVGVRPAPAGDRGRSAGSGQLREPYIPPTLLKAWPGSRAVGFRPTYQSPTGLSDVSAACLPAPLSLWPHV